MRKEIFINEHDWFDIVEDHKNFSIKIEELKLYVLEFKEDCIIKPKTYSSNCAIRGDEH